MPAPLSIGIVAEVRLYRETLATSLAQHPGFAVAWSAAGLDEALNGIAQSAASVVVVDMATRDALHIIQSVREAAREVSIVAFAAHELDDEIIACAEAGVAAFVPREATVEDLIAAIASAARGEARCSPRTTAVLLRFVSSAASRMSSGPITLLTTRERDILELIERGFSNKDIARSLHIQVATVKNHVHSLLEKMHVTSRSEAAARHRAAGRPPRAPRVAPVLTRTDKI